MGSNYQQIRTVLISNHLLKYIDLMVSIELKICFRFQLIMHYVMVNFMLQLMVTNKGILLTNNMSFLMVMLLLDFIIYLGTVI